MSRLPSSSSDTGWFGIAGAGSGGSGTVGGGGFGGSGADGLGFGLSGVNTGHFFLLKHKHIIYD